MAELGRAPLRVVDNELRCLACDELLPGSAAGGTIVATYAGPVLVKVSVDTADRSIHDCGGFEAQKPPGRRKRARTPRHRSDPDRAG